MLNEHSNMQEIIDSFSFSENNDTPRNEVVKEQNSGLTQTQPKATATTTTTTTQSTYSHHSFAEFCSNPAPIKFYIKSYVQEKALHMIFGAPGSGKSFVAVDMAASIACPEVNEWQGRSIKHGPVIYMAGEGSAGLRKRFAGWAKKREINPANVQLEVIDEVFHLDENSEQYNVNTTIANIKAIYEKPALVVIDTLNVFMAGDENKAQDMGAFLSVCRKLILDLGCSVILVHHSGVQEKNRARGSSALQGAMDIELQVTKNGNLITLTQTKNKEAEPEKPMTVALEKVDIDGWLDDDGYLVNTCTIEPYHSDSDSQVIEVKEVKLSSNQKNAINAQQTFKEAVKRHGRKIQDEQTGESLIGVELEDWRKVSYELSIKDNTSKKNTEFNRGRETLHEKGILLKHVIDNHDYYFISVAPDSKADRTFIFAVNAAFNEREKLEQTEAEARS